MDRVKIAEGKFIDGLACSQAIVSTYCEQFGIDKRTALNLSSGFAGGMRIGKTCGSVTGAIIILGLVFSGPNSEKSQDRREVYTATREFISVFTEKFGSIECKDLLSVDLNTDAGRAEAKEKKLFSTLCPKFVKGSAEILESLVKFS